MPPTQTLPAKGTELLPAVLMDTDLASDRPAPDFKVFGMDLEIVTKAAKSDDGKTRLRCIASSSVQDRHGDVMTENCVRGMRKQAAGLTIFLNHSYKVPEDVFGMVESATTKNEDGSVLLLLTIIADESNPRVGKTIESIENGIRTGVSIGAMLVDYEYKDEDAWLGGLIINEVELLEASIVGIPANPKSWVDQVVKNFTTKGLMQTRPAKVIVTESVTEAVVKAAPVPVLEADGPEAIVSRYLEQFEAGEWGTGDVEDELTAAVAKSVAWGIDHGTPADFAEQSVEDLVAQIISQAVAPAVGKSEEAAAVAATPTEATVGDQDPDALEALSEEISSGTAEPGDADEAEMEARAELTELADSGALASLSELTGILEGTLISLSQERVARASAEVHRDQLAKQLHEANDTVSAAVDLVRTVMNMPVGRKTQMARVMEESKFVSRMRGSVYDEDVLATISKGGSQ